MGTNQTAKGRSLGVKFIIFSKCRTYNKVIFE